MKVYRIKVNGKAYEVEVELVENKEGNLTETSRRDDIVSNAIKSDKIEGNGEIVKAPMQGSILSIKVSKGNRVSKGDVLLILEAMKMENEILSPVSGVVSDIFVSEGKNVNNQDVLLVIS
ncbi:biotin/lipoyl-containing protein [Candidatus Arthromitus sp. SFB-rat-Yit]|uniref:biotin/lipoyl-containing protein n=1 Tax=Candidatus Arthromitus sp. SFB-rat-Yit TaxID=1041504 RepID=UPI000227A4FA|nr:biotin/lipoyl-containing protein [Candidatus Arthromitus sp. SFB-rat-Yit]BAK81579.1 biotin/lipoyl attachment domain-containing protein [Candidatus Arthromitus sp. SFB-rat-Yit]